MKLLTWMHRKLRQGGTETLGEFLFGQPIVDEKQNQGNGSWKQMQKDGQSRISFASLDTTELPHFEEKASTEYFEGFLAIGTLGTETGGITEPETPTFEMSIKKLAGEETEVTESELRLINDELERVIAAEAKEDVSNGRMSHATTIIPENTSNGNLNCPLQEYLLVSAVEMPEKTVVKKKKKENRVSLGELFEKQKVEEVPEAKYESGEKIDDKDGEKTVMNLLKKILKKKIASSATEKKLSKILRKFHRKVHPECSLAATEKPDTSNKIGLKDMLPCNAGYNKNSHKHALYDDDISDLSQRYHHIGHMRGSKSHSSSSQFTVGGSDSNSGRECWIKTDAEYLVLEL